MGSGTGRRSRSSPSQTADARARWASSHTQAKQVYRLTGSDPHDDQQFHLLAPLYPTSLAHRVYPRPNDKACGRAPNRRIEIYLQAAGAAP